jgi:hypothetical protein
MEDKNYNCIYAVKILLTDGAWSNSVFNNEIKEGKIEKILYESEGVNNFWKGTSNCQNVAVVDNLENSLSLIDKLIVLPYVREVTLFKDGLLSVRDGDIYIPVKY